MSCRSAAAIGPLIEGAPEPASDHRMVVRQAEWRFRQAERRLELLRGRLASLAAAGPEQVSARSEVHLGERALFNRRLELREACAAARSHLQSISAAAPDRRPVRGPFLLAGE